jgi:hypothetical protein
MVLVAVRLCIVPVNWTMSSPWSPDSHGPQGEFKRPAVIFSVTGVERVEHDLGPQLLVLGGKATGNGSCSRRAPGNGPRRRPRR